MKMMTYTGVKKQNGLIQLFFMLILMILVSGCALFSGVKHYVRPNTEFDHIKRIAVLPFENLTSDKFADDRIRSIVIIDLLSRELDVVEPGEVMSVLRKLKIRSLRTISSDDMKNIGEMLKVHAIMTGSAGVFKMSKGVSVSYPEVSLSLMLYEPLNGNIIWSAWHTTGGASFWTRHFGTEGATLDETAKGVIDDILDTLF